MKNPEHEYESLESSLISLLNAARSGGREEQNQLMTQLRPYLHLLAKMELGALLQQKIGHSDIVQKSCIRVLEGVGQFRGTTEGELRNWLKLVLKNEVRQVGDFRAEKRDFRREVPLDNGDSRRNVLQPIDSMPTPRTDALAQEKIQLMRRAMNQLPEEYQQVIRLRSWQRLSFPEIATRMEKSINATEKVWYRAIQRLRRELSDLDESTP